MQIGYIFDLDGVITDTTEYHYRSWKQLSDEEGLDFNREVNEHLRGRSRRESLDIILNGQPLTGAKLEEFLTRKNDYYRAYLTEITPDNLLPGVADLLKEAKAQGIKLGLGSASKNANDVCERLGVIELLDTLGDGHSVVNAKPEPDIFVWVAGGLGLNPQQCIVFEDAAAGIDAALKGGFWTVGLGPIERVGHAHKVRDDLQGASVSEFRMPLS